MTTRRARLGLAAGLAMACGAWAAGAFAAVGDADRPNIVLILTDDEDLHAHEFMPKTKALVEDQGVALDNYFVTYSFCCPSRATILRGQYAHNHRIQGNQQPTGGARKFHATGGDGSTIATWLQGRATTRPSTAST